jgi:hypothetical protein
MDRIETLLEKLENRIPVSLAKKIDKLDDFEEKLLVAQKDYTDEPTEENKDSLKEVTDFVNSLRNEVTSNLESLVAQKTAKQSEQKNENVAGKPAPIVTPAPVDKPKEEKKGVSIFGIALGVVLLVGTAGAYNYFSKNK